MYRKDKKENFDEILESDPSDSNLVEDSKIISLFEEASKDEVNSHVDPDLDFKSIDKDEREETNQGLAHSKNGARILSNNLYHRDISECYMTQACINKNVLFFTNAVCLKGISRRRAELDFLILDEKSEHWGILELQGGSHFGELAVDRDGRLKRFDDANVFIRYYDVPDYVSYETSKESIDWAEECLEDFLNKLRKKKKFPIITWEDYSK